MLHVGGHAVVRLRRGRHKIALGGSRPSAGGALPLHPITRVRATHGGAKGPGSPRLYQPHPLKEGEGVKPPAFLPGSITKAVNIIRNVGGGIVLGTYAHDGPRVITALG